MCLVALRWLPDTEWPLIVAANRDEFYQRASAPAHHWPQNPGLFAGLDKEAGGTWMGIHTRGRFAVVTNFMQPDEIGTVSRGALTYNFLTGDQLAREYLDSLQETSKDYAGFNLLIADDTGLWYFTNRSRTTTNGNSLQQLPPGTYGLSNHLLDTPWPKLLRLKKGFIRANEKPPPDVATLMALLQDDWQPEETDLPDTGVGIEQERLLGSCFISSRAYGTRTSTVLILDRDGRLGWHEQHYGPDGVMEGRYDWQSRLRPGWMTTVTSQTASTKTL